MVIMGIDQSFTSTGIVVTNGDELHMEVIKTVKEDDIFNRMIVIKDTINAMVGHFGVDLVVIEALAFGSFGDATRNLAGLQAVIITSLRDRFPDINIITVAPTSLKKSATGNGKAKKKDMFDSVHEPFKSQIETFKVKDGRYDLADAYHLHRWGREYVS